MKILITTSVTAADTLFEGLGQLCFVADDALANADLTDIDAVIMRSQCTLTAPQVKDTRVRFVGSATAGLDHLPVDALKAQGVTVAHAPGCNANSVADYVLGAWLALGQPLQGKTLGLIGYGAVGQAVAKRAAAWGLHIIVNDPPRLAAQLPIPYETVELPVLFSLADIVSVHVPLVLTGPWPTLNLVNAPLLTKLKPGVILINTARGDVCDAKALVAAKAKGLIADLIIDVWPDEPRVDYALWQAATFATPHIAGHSYVAKWQGTWQLYEAWLQHVGQPMDKSREALLPRELGVALTPASTTLNEQAALWHYVRQVYDITQDHQAMQSWLSLTPAQQVAQWGAYRANYPRRSELSLATIDQALLTPWQREVLLSAGVTIC